MHGVPKKALDKGLSRRVKLKGFALLFSPCGNLRMMAWTDSAKVVSRMMSLGVHFYFFYGNKETLCIHLFPNVS